jgi:DNA-binding response OmpR family regulator
MRYSTTYRTTIHCPWVWIVDARRSEYDHLLSDARAKELEVRIHASGPEFLRNWFAGVPDFCIVNIQLPGLSGFDLVEMVRPFPEGMTVCLLADEYAADDEIRALGLGVHGYLCKPLVAATFFELAHCSKTSPRVRPAVVGGRWRMA